MRKSIFKSICFAAIGVFLASLVLIMGVLYNYFSDMQHQQLKMQTTIVAHSVEKEGADFFKDIDLPDIRITWIDSSGQVLYDSSFDAETLDNHLDRAEVKLALEQGYAQTSRNSSTLMQKQLYCAQKLKDGTVIRLSSTHLSVLSLLITMVRPMLLVAIIAILLSFALAYRISNTVVNHLKKQVIQIEDAEKMRKEFTANVSHELKTPLHSISGYAELMKNGIVKSEDIEGFSERIYSEAQRMITLVDDIIRLSHLDEGEENERMVELDVSVIAGDVVKSLSDIAKEKGVALYLESAGTPKRSGSADNSIKGGTSDTLIKGIPELINGIIYNLCDNAIKYSKEQGTVRVSVSSDKNNVLLRVADDGIGIAKEHLDRIFERFYRVDKSRSKQVGGTGLGLSIVKHSAMLHNAQINVSSEPDQGTTIEVLFPKLTKTLQ